MSPIDTIAKVACRLSNTDPDVLSDAIAPCNAQGCETSQLSSIWNCHLEPSNGKVVTMKTMLTQIDKAGRIVLPKPLRRHFNLLAGDKIRLSVEKNGIRLEPAETGGELMRKGSVLVFTGEFVEPITTEKINEMISEDRERQGGGVAQKLFKK